MSEKLKRLSKWSSGIRQKRLYKNVNYLINKMNMTWVSIYEYYLSHKEKSAYFMKYKHEVRTVNEIEVNLS